MVRLELLGGARSPEQWEQLSELLSALHNLEAPEEIWQEAAGLGFQLRRRRISVPHTDLLIAAVGLKSGAVVVHRNRHFDLMAAPLQLPVESYVTG
jgi:predicted nucleic acid-binding protein